MAADDFLLLLLCPKNRMELSDYYVYVIILQLMQEPAIAICSILS